MADIELVIKIDEEQYEHIKHMTMYEVKDYHALMYDICERIKNGTLLPKGHGRLIDADTLEYTCNSDECGMLTGCNHCQYHIITEDEIDDAPTIIGADKESGE